MAKVPFLGGAYEGRSSNVAPQTCINYFYESGEDWEALVTTPGSTVFNNSFSGPVRGGIEYNGKAYFVIGPTLYEFDSVGNGVAMGTLNTTTGQVSMAHNGARDGANQQIMILDGTTGHIFDNTTKALSPITDTDMVASSICAFYDGYFVYTQDNSDRFWITSLYDGTTIDSADFFTAEGDPDEVSSIVVDQRQVFVFGTKTTELWYNSGDLDQTLQRFQGGYFQHGCAAAYSAQRFDNTVAWLSENERGNAQVMRFEGGNPVVMSTPEVNYQLSQYTTISDATAYVYQDEGHEFYVLTFPTEGATWVYDAKEQAWHQRAHSINGVFPNRERYSCHVFAFNKHLVGDFENGTIYQLDTSVGTIDGARIERERTAPPWAIQEARLRVSSVQLDMDEGIGNSNDANDADFWLSYSKDGGNHFSPEHAQSAGDEGEYANRVVWRRLGHARNWIFRLRTFTPHSHVLKGLIARPWGFSEGAT